MCCVNKKSFRYAAIIISTSFPRNGFGDYLKNLSVGVYQGRLSSVYMEYLCVYENLKGKVVRFSAC